MAAAPRAPLPYPTSGFLDCNACLAAARLTALGPLFFFFRRAAARSALESFGARGMPPSIQDSARESATSVDKGEYSKQCDCPLAPAPHAPRHRLWSHTPQYGGHVRDGSIAPSGGR